MQWVLSRFWSELCRVYIIVGLILMAMIIWPYHSGRLDIDFLLSKTRIIHMTHYRLAFYVHISSSLLVLLTIPLLLSQALLLRSSPLHKVLGRIYVLMVLLFAAPSGLVMGMYANGGVVAIINFMCLSIIWWIATFLGFTAILKSNVLAHRVWMIRSIALSLSAVTLRFLMLGSYWLPNIEMNILYTIASVLSWLFNIVVAEYFIIKKRSIFLETIGT